LQSGREKNIKMEYVDVVVLLISCIFEISMYYIFYCGFFVHRRAVTSIKKILASAGAISLLFVINIANNSYLNLFGCTLVIWIYSLALFSSKFGRRLLYFLISLFVGIGCEFLFSVLLGVTENTNVKISDISLQMLTMKLMTFVILMILKQLLGMKKQVNSNNKIFLYYLCIPIASIIIMLLTYYAGLEMSPDRKILLSVSFMLMLLGNVLVFYAYDKYSEELNKSAERELVISKQKMDLQYYNNIQNVENEYKEYIHNISNHLKTIGELAAANQDDTILSIIKNLNIDIEQGTMKMFCKNSVINAVLSEKKSMAEKEDIEMDIYMEPGINFNGILDVDIIAIFGNLLDNSLRAVQSVENKRITIRVYTENEGGFQIIKIVNCFNEPIKYTDDGFASTKKENGIHGIGIKSVNNIAERYGGFLECFVEDNEFTAICILPIREK
jgi:hypothetical protein